MLTWGASTAVSKYTCWCYIYWQPCHFCSQDTVSEYPPLITMPTFHCPQLCATMIQSFFSKSMSDTAITHITLSEVNMVILLMVPKSCQPVEVGAKYLIGPQPRFLNTESPGDFCKFLKHQQQSSHSLGAEVTHLPHLPIGNHPVDWWSV